MKQQKKTVFLIDGSSFLYRAYYGMRPLHTPSGESVQAVYGFCRMIKQLINKFDPHYLGIVWDSKGKTTRHDMYEEYKATRDAPPSDLFEQKKYIVEFADLIDCAQIAQAKLEADDILYSIALDMQKKGFNVVVISSDKDLGQMITDNISMYDPVKEIMYTPEKFVQKMSFAVDRLPLYFSLLGDTSDNIPGVRGVGKKSALELAQQFSSLKELYNNLDKVTIKRAKTALEKHKEDAFLSLDLFLLQYHPIAITADKLKFDHANWRNALPLFKKLEFKSLIREIGDQDVSADDKMSYWQKKDFVLVDTQQKLDDLCALLREKKSFAIDTETNGLRPLESLLVGMSFCVQEEQAFYVPCNHVTDEQQLKPEVIIATLKPILEDENYKKWLHNAKFDQKVLWANGVNMRGVEHDTMLAASLINKDWQRVGLKYLSQVCFDEHMFSYADMVTNKKLADFSYVPIKNALYYAAADALQTFKLCHYMVDVLKKEKLFELYNTIEMPTTNVLFHMECLGIYCDVQHLYELGISVAHELTAIEKNIAQHLPEHQKSINLNSPKQVAQLLFEDLKLPPKKKSAKGTYSTDQSVLKELAREHEVPKLLVYYRELAKLQNTYIQALPLYVNQKTKRIHTSYNQVAVATGRLSSTDPNLQNIPTDGSRYGAQVRAAFKAQDGYTFISADYSQIELRVMAHLSQEPALINAFTHGHDIHAQTAAYVFDVPLEKVDHDQRQVGKRINFSVLYGITPYGLRRDIGVSFGQARDYIDRYFARYPQVSKWMEGVIEFAKKHGYVQTWQGRRRYIPAINETNRVLYEEAKRVAINTVAQGTAAELLKVGMIRVFDALVARGYDERILLQIHDELLLEVPKNRAQEAEKIVKDTLESVVDWSIPLTVATRIGDDWKKVSK